MKKIQGSLRKTRISVSNVVEAREDGRIAVVNRLSVLWVERCVACVGVMKRLVCLMQAAVSRIIITR